MCACVFRYLHILNRGVRRGERGCTMCVSAKFVPKEILKINRIPLKSKPSKQQRELGVSADYTPPLPPLFFGLCVCMDPWQLIRNSVSCATISTKYSRLAPWKKADGAASSRQASRETDRQADSRTELTDSAKTC